MIIEISLFLLIIGFGYLAFKVVEIIIEKIKSDVEDYN